MTAVSRDYRVRVATAGSDAVAGNVDFTLTVSDLHGVPVVTTQIVHPTRGRVESRPFTLEVLDTNAGLLANLTSSERWDALGRILDVQFSDDGVAWTTFGTGRISGLSENGGPGKFNIEVSDEGWKARRSKVFTAADTTQMWPHGIKARWGEYNAATPATGTLATSSGDLHRIKLVASDGPNPSRDVLPALLDFVDRDKKSFEEVRFGADATEGNFEHLRLNYDGTDYEVVSFGPIGITNDLVGTLEEPAILQPDSEFRTVTVHAWVHSLTTPPASGDAYLHAPTAEPSDENPLHVGLADATHTWGVADTGSFLPQEIHPATLTRVYWDETGQVYDAASVTALESDSSFRKVAPRITETPDDPDAWFQKHIWGPAMIATLVNGEGARVLVDMRQPQDVDPDTLDVIDASNARANTWRLLGRETVNSVTWRLLELTQHGRAVRGDQAVGFRKSGTPSDRGCDGIFAREVEFGPFEGDTLAEVGTHSLTIEALALHRYQESVFFERRRGRERWLEIQSRELFDIYQDGAHRGSIEVGRTLAETLEEGDLVILDQDELKGPNPQTEARSGQRLVRILTMERHPTHAVVGYLDLGKKAQPLAAPTVVVAQDVSDEELVNVTISNVPAGATAIVEFGYSASATPPDEWAFRRVEVGNETITFGDAPGTGWAHARAKSTAPNRIRSTWATGSDQLATRPKITAARVELDEAEPVVFGTPDANTNGVRITYHVHNPDDDPSPANAADYDATNLSGGIALTGVVVADDQVVTVELEPWTGFSGGSVSGTAGPKVSASAAGRDVIANTVAIQGGEFVGYDATGQGASLQLRLLMGPGTQALRIHYKDPGGATNERYDLNVTPDESLLHSIQDATLDELDPSGTDEEFTLVVDYSGAVIEVTPFDAANGGQGSGNAGTTVEFAISNLQSTGAPSMVFEDQAGSSLSDSFTRIKQGALFDVQDDGGTPVISLLGDAELYGDLSAAADIKTILEAAQTDLISRFSRGIIRLGPEVLQLSTFALQSEVILDLNGAQLEQPANAHTQEATGTSSGSNTSTTLEDTGAGWTSNEHVGRTVYISGGTGSGQSREIVSNDADTLTLHPRTPWATTPDATSTYEILTPKHMFTLSSVDNEKCGLVGKGKLFGRKSSQKALNKAFFFDGTGGGPFDTGDHEHFLNPEKLIIKEFKGDAIHIDGLRETRILNVVAQACDGWGLRNEGTDNDIAHCVFQSCGLSGVLASGTSSRYTAVKAFGCGSLGIQDNQEGFLIDQPSQDFANCHAQENPGYGARLDGSGVHGCKLDISTDFNGEGGVLFDGASKNIHTGRHENEGGFAYAQPNAVEFLNGASENRCYIVSDSLTSNAVVRNSDLGSNYVEWNAESQARHFNKWGVAGTDDTEHFTFGKWSSPTTNNPQYTWKTGSESVPFAKFQGYDGTTTYTFMRADYGNQILYLGDSGGPVTVTMPAAVTMQSTLDVTGSLTVGGGAASEGISIKSNLPFFNLWDEDAGVDEKVWQSISAGGDLRFRARNDAGTNANTWLEVTRSGFVPQSIDFKYPVTMSDTLDVTGLTTLTGVHIIGDGGTGPGAIREAGDRFIFQAHPNGFRWNDDAGSGQLMDLTNDGHLALGTTDVEGWSSSYRALQLAAENAIISATGGDGSLYVLQNAYIDTGWKYKTTDEASQIRMVDGAVTIRVASSGTADTAITWEDALTIPNTGPLTTSRGALEFTGTGYGAGSGDAFWRPATNQLGAVIAGNPAFLVTSTLVQSYGAFVLASGEKYVLDGQAPASSDTYIYEANTNRMDLVAGTKAIAWDGTALWNASGGATLGKSGAGWSTIYGVAGDFSGTVTMGGASSGALVRAAKLQNTGAAQIGSKAGASFYNEVTTTGQVEAGRIEVGMQNIGAATWSSDMLFYVAESATLAEAARLTPNKRFGLQNTSPEAIFHMGDEAGSPFSNSTLGAIFEAEGSTASTTEHGYGFYFLKSATPAGGYFGVDVRLEASHGSTSHSVQGFRVIAQYTGTGNLSNGNSLIAARFLAWANNASCTVSKIISVLIDDPIKTAGASITDAITLVLDAPSSVGSATNRTLFLSDPSGTGADTIFAASGAKLTTGGVWTDAPSWSWKKRNVQPIRPRAARDVLLAMQPILYDQLREHDGTLEAGMGFAIDRLPDWVRYLDGRVPEGMEGIVPMHFATLAIAGWQDHEIRLQDHEGRITQLEQGGEQ